MVEKYIKVKVSYGLANLNLNRVNTPKRNLKIDLLKISHIVHDK